VVDFLTLLKMSALGRPVDVKPILEKLQEVESMISGMGTGAVSLQLPPILIVRGWLEEYEPFFRCGEGTATQSGVVYEEQLQSTVRVTQLLVYVDSGANLALLKDGVQVFPRGADIAVHGTWLSLNPPSRIATFEKGSKLQLAVKLQSGAAQAGYKYIIVGSTVE